MSFASITLFDYILLAVLLLFIVQGLWVGFLRQIPFVLALIGSYLASAYSAGDLMPHLSQLTESPKIIFGGFFLILLLLSTLVLKLIAVLLAKVVRIKVVGWVDRFFLGAPLALFKGGALVIFVLMFVAATLAPADHFFRDSLAEPYLKQAIKMVRNGIRDKAIRKDLRPRKEKPVPQQDAEANEIAPVQQEEVMPPSPSVPPTAQVVPQQPWQGEQAPQVQEGQEIQEPDVDDPASSTEVITH
jgi:membrane protein required for colicin V production